MPKGKVDRKATAEEIRQDLRDLLNTPELQEPTMLISFEDEITEVTPEQWLYLMQRKLAGKREK